MIFSHAKQLEQMIVICNQEADESTPCVIISNGKQHNGKYNISNNCIVAYYMSKNKIKDHFYNIDNLFMNVHKKFVELVDMVGNVEMILPLKALREIMRQQQLMFSFEYQGHCAYQENIASYEFLTKG